MASKREMMKKLFLTYIKEGDEETRIAELDEAPSWSVSCFGHSISLTYYVGVENLIFCGEGGGVSFVNSSHV